MTAPNNIKSNYYIWLWLITNICIIKPVNQGMRRQSFKPRDAYDISLSIRQKALKIVLEGPIDPGKWSEYQPELSGSRTKKIFLILSFEIVNA